MDVRKLKRAWDVFEAVSVAKHETRRVNEELGKMKYGADYGLDISDKLGRAIDGTFSRVDLADSVFIGVNMAPKFNPKLWNRFPWRFKKPHK